MDGSHAFLGIAMFLDVDGNKVFALTFGRGPRTLLAHSGWVDNFEDWTATLGPPSESWRTVVYDHRGGGETRVPLEHVTPEALIEDVFLVLANGHGEIVDPNDDVPPRLPPSQWPGATHVERLRWFAERCTPEPDSEHLRRRATNILSRATEAAAERIFTMQPERPVDWPAALRNLRLPVLILHGKLDVLARTRNMRCMHSLIPGSRLVEFERTGHFPVMTRPQDVAWEIDAFLRSLPS